MGDEATPCRSCLLDVTRILLKSFKIKYMATPKISAMFNKALNPTGLRHLVAGSPTELSTGIVDDFNPAADISRCPPARCYHPRAQTLGNPNP
jgi:hypothetical protein